MAAYSRTLLNVALTAAENTAGALTVYIRFNPAFTDPESGIFAAATLAAPPSASFPLSF